HPTSYLDYPAPLSLFSFLFNDTAPTEIYTLSLHDALPIFDVLKDHKNLGVFLVWSLVYWTANGLGLWVLARGFHTIDPHFDLSLDRKSTRLNSSHLVISYAVFCLKKKKIIDTMML